MCDMRGWERSWLNMADTWRRFNGIELKRQEPRSILLSRLEVGMSSCAGVNSMVKLLRAHGGCLGRNRRRRTWQAAISFGEPHTGVISEDFRMGKPTAAKPPYG